MQDGKRFKCLDTVRSLADGKEIGMKTLVKFSDMKDVYKNKELAERYRHWFPIKPSEGLAGIVADLIGDGHIQPEPYLRLDYTSKDKKELRRFGKEIFGLFGIKGKIRPCRTNRYGKTYNYGINCRVLAKLLILVGTPAGAKVNQAFRIPKWILENKKFFRRFISRLYSCEGCVDRKTPWIGIEMYKNEKLLEDGIKFFQDISNGLYKFFDIVTSKPFPYNSISIRKDGIITIPVKITIRRKDSVKRFFKFVGFDDKNKQLKLKRSIRYWS
jgi:hypothetical protein